MYSPAWLAVAASTPRRRPGYFRAVSLATFAAIRRAGNLYRSLTCCFVSWCGTPGAVCPTVPAASDMPDETDDPHYADARHFYTVQTWTKNGRHLTEMLYAGNNPEKACEVFRAFAKKRPRSRITIRQRTRVIAEWPSKWALAAPSNDRTATPSPA